MNHTGNISSIASCERRPAIRLSKSGGDLHGMALYNDNRNDSDAALHHLDKCLAFFSSQNQQYSKKQDSNDNNGQEQQEIEELMHKLLEKTRDLRSYFNIDQRREADKLQSQRYECILDMEDITSGGAGTTSLAVKLATCHALEGDDQNSDKDLMEKLQELKQISEQAKRLQRVSGFRRDDALACLGALQGNLQLLSHVMSNAYSNDGDENDKEKYDDNWLSILPEPLQWLGRLQLPTRNEDQDVEVIGGGFDYDEEGKTRTMDYCSTCDWEISFSAPRWRCVPCREVLCENCYTLLYDKLHTQCCSYNKNDDNDNGGSHDTNLDVVLEHIHPSMIRLEAAACNSLSQAILTVMQGFASRPCFCRYDEQNWMTYEQVLDRVLLLVTVLCREQQTVARSQEKDEQALHLQQMHHVVLCFPAGSMEFYLWDLACILSGITTIGIPNNPPPPAKDWPSTATHVICDHATREVFHDNIPPHLVWLDAQQAVDPTLMEQVEPYDVDLLLSDTGPDPVHAIYSIFLTSGTTGKPKLIPTTRRFFLDETFRDKPTKWNDDTTHATVSYLPPCWGTDRGLVYQAFQSGHRIGFAPPNPSLSQILETMEKIKPTTMVLMPTIVEFLCCSFQENGQDRPALGGNLRYVTVGSAPVSQGMLQDFKQKYNIRNVNEGYGTTEIGGIATDGWIHSSLPKQIRIRNPNYISENSGEIGKDEKNHGYWLNKDKEGVVGELWIGDKNTGDIVELTKHGRKLRVLGRSGDAASFKLDNGKWCSLIDIESEITRACRPDLLDEVMVWCNSQNVLVLLVSASSFRFHGGRNDTNAMLQEILRRSNSLSREMQPKAILFTDQPLPKTITMKLQRGKVIGMFQKAADSLAAEQQEPRIMEAAKQQKQSKDDKIDAADIAERVLGRPMDRAKSFLENGGDSMTAVQWLREVKLQLGQAIPEWRSLLNDPLDSHSTMAQQKDRESDVSLTYDSDGDGDDEDHKIPTDMDAPFEHYDASAPCILLTGATGFFGRHVLRALLEKDPLVQVVCYTRDESKSKLCESDRVVVVTEVPLDRKYRSVIHLAANVNHVLDYKALKHDNVDLTEKLLRWRLAPMLYCSTSSTRKGHAPFADGYTQSKWKSEQMVVRSRGGTCFWPPLLLWGNPRDWLMRILQHCLQSKQVPPLSSSFGFVTACPVDVAADDLVSGRPCSVWDLDLSQLFGVGLQKQANLQTVSMDVFLEGLEANIDSPAYPLLPMLQANRYIGNSRTPSLEIMPLEWESIWPMIEGCCNHY